MKFNGTTFDQTLYLSITQGGAAASKAVVLNSTLDYSGINNFGCSIFTASTSAAAPVITCNSLTASSGITTNSLTIAGDQNITGTLYLGGVAVTASAVDINFNDITTLGSFQTSKTMTLDSAGRGLMPLGTSDSNCIRFYGGTANRETMNIYRVADTTGLVIASRTTSASNNKTGPLLLY